MSALANHAFAKMNGIGNDFVVLDARARALTLSASAMRRTVSSSAICPCSKA